MANPPPPYANISGITRTIMKDNQEETIANYDGNARPGELVVNLNNNDLYIGNTNGNLTLITFGSGVSNPTSFDPQFTDASGTVAGVTTTGTYTLVGPLCYYHVFLDFATCTNFGTGQYRITLPFATNQTMTIRGGTLHQNTGNSLYHIAGITENQISTTIQNLYYSGSTTDLAWKYNTPVGATTVTTTLDISGVYQIV